jgi:beta-N-acetylhexosaminidase
VGCVSTPSLSEGVSTETADLTALVDGCLLPAFDGVTAPDWLIGRLAAGLGGVTLFARNIESTDQVERLTAQLRAANPDVLICVDEEGGDVTRLDVATGSAYPGNFALGAVDDPELTRRVAASIGADLRDVGINVNLGPVADVNSNPDNPVIGVRSFGADPTLVARHSAAYVEGLQSTGVAACTKHFPGHGDTAVDSHHGLPTVSDSPAALAAALEPFRAAIEAGTRAIMTAHIVVPAYGDEPATINRRILDGLLRSELRFDGLVVTDALDMGAIRRGVGDVEGAVRAFAAGADALCLSGREERDVLDAIRAGVVEAVNSGRLSAERLAESADRVRATAAWGQPAGDRYDRSIGLDAARKAIRTTGDVVLRAGDPVVVQLEPQPNMAAGVMPWGVTGPLRALGASPVLVTRSERDGDTDPVQDATGRPVVLVMRDGGRHEWQRVVQKNVCAARPDAVVVEMGIPGPAVLDAAGYIVTHGAGLVNGVAAAELLLGRTSREVPQ